ncbi:hypothetical protein OROHE_021568 [Orobanche hederae]
MCSQLKNSKSNMIDEDEASDANPFGTLLELINMDLVLKLMQLVCFAPLFLMGNKIQNNKKKTNKQDTEQEEEN